VLPWGEIFSLGCAILWAIAVLLFRKSGEELTPVALNALKGAVGLVLFSLTLLVLRRPFFPPEQDLQSWLTLLLSGALGIGVADSLFFASLNRLGATGSAIVDCVYSPFVVIAAYLYLGEPLHLSLLCALALMVAAILLGFYQPPTAGAPIAPAPAHGAPAVVPPARGEPGAIGVALGIASMLLMAAGIVLAKPVLNQADVWWATPVRLLGGEIVLLSLAGVSPRHRRAVLHAIRPGKHWRVALPSALVGSYLAMVLWIAGMKYTLASVAGILNQTSALFVPLFAAIFLGEKLSARRATAVALGFAGALVATLR
jgi:drug/metabolite transporter (DMT)-like permease